MTLLVLQQNKIKKWQVRTNTLYTHRLNRCIREEKRNEEIVLTKWKKKD